MGGGGGMEELTEDEKRALRVAPLTSLPSSYGSQPPRKLQDPNGLSSIDPELIELAVKTARDTVVSSGTSSSGRTIQHVASFEDVEVSSDDDKIENTKLSKKKKKKKGEKKKKQNKKHKITVHEDAKLKRPNKKLKL